MRILNLKRLLFLCLALAAAAAPARPQAGAENLLPERVGDFRGGVRVGGQALDRHFRLEDFHVERSDGRTYSGPTGEKFSVTAVRTRTAAAAYSLLRHFASHPESSDLSAGLTPGSLRVIEGVGLGRAEPSRVRFIKGATFVQVQAMSAQAERSEAVLAFSRLFADTLVGDVGDLPILVLHLPEWEKKAAEDLGFAVTLPALQQAAGHRPVLDVIDFDGGAEAATAKYGGAQLVVVEFTTPQHAFDADAAVNARLAELRAAGQPAPALYRREGNYAVFVFDAPDEATAAQLASDVKYEKDVRWLGRNPHADEIAVREYTSTMGGTILAVIITTGLAIVGSLAIGGAIGGLIFLRRRARLAEQEVYTDAGGMLRLNLEDLNTPPASGLLGQGKE